jgi:AcrR family transcriptional regulator
MKRKQTAPSYHRRHPVQNRAQVTVDAILDAVMKILERQGIASITTNKVAEVAGVSIGSVYQYFPNKHALFVALHARHVAHVQEVIRRHILTVEEGDLGQLVNSFIDGMIEAHGANPKLSELLQSEVPHRADGSGDFATRLHEDFRAALAKHDRGSGLRVRPSTRAFFVASMVDALGHAIVLRRPAGLSLRKARQESSHAILAYLHS